MSLQLNCATLLSSLENYENLIQPFNSSTKFVKRVLLMEKKLNEKSNSHKNFRSKLRPWLSDIIAPGAQSVNWKKKKKMFLQKMTISATQYSENKISEVNFHYVRCEILVFKQNVE